MNLNPLSFAGDKAESKEILLDFLKAKNLHVEQEDFNRPWGGFFLIDEKDLYHFIDEFFPEFKDLKSVDEKLSPKILLVAPNARLSWQYHFRRAEIWKVLFGPIGVMQNKTDEQTEPKWHQTGELIQHETEVRHRLIGAENWGVVAEVWKHTDPSNPSAEDDIVRLQDDYGR